jgi:hypothetical protein
MKTLKETLQAADEMTMKIAKVELSHGNTIRLLVNDRTGGTLMVAGKGMTLVNDDPKNHWKDTFTSVDEINSVDQL